MARSPTRASTPMRLSPMVLLSRPQFFLETLPRRPRTCSFSTLFPLVSRPPSCLHYHHNQCRHWWMVCATWHGTKSGSQHVVAVGCPKNEILGLFFMNKVCCDLLMSCDVNQWSGIAVNDVFCAWVMNPAAIIARARLSSSDEYSWHVQGWWQVHYLSNELRDSCLS